MNGDPTVPPNVRCGPGTQITGDGVFRRFFSEHADGVVIGSGCRIDATVFAVGKKGKVSVGNSCVFTGAVLLAEAEIVIGSFVAISWSATIADTDFHPLTWEEREPDMYAMSPLAGRGVRPPPFPCARVVIEDGVWIGPKVAVLKGVRIGAGSIIEAGAVVTKEVPPGSVVRGVPGKVVGVAEP